MRWRLLADALTLCAVSTSASAQLLPVAVQGDAGAWVVNKGTIGATPVCAMFAKSGPSQFTLFLSPGRFEFDVSDNTRSAPRTSIAMPIQLDFSGVPGADGIVRSDWIGYSDGVDDKVQIGQENAKDFIHEFTAGTDLTIFGGATEGAPWTISLHGTTPAEMAMAHCAEDLQIPGLPTVFAQFAAPAPNTSVPDESSGTVTPPESSADSALPDTIAPDEDSSQAPSPSASSEPTQPSAALCKAMTDAMDRLHCYDAFMGVSGTSVQPAPAVAAPAPAVAAPAAVATPAPAPAVAVPPSDDPSTASSSSSATSSDNNPASPTSALPSLQQQEDDCNSINRLGTSYVIVCDGSGDIDVLPNMLRNGDWSWTKSFENGKCVFQFSVSGVYQGDSINKSYQCIFKPWVIKACTYFETNYLDGLGCASKSFVGRLEN